MSKIKIATWNMHWAFENSENRARAWDYLENSICPDIALVQEAVPPHERLNKPATLYQEIGGTRPWGSGILCRDFNLQEVAFENSHPGAVIAGDVDLPETENLPPGTKFTVISLYGILDDHTYVMPALHRMLSDLTHILNGKMGKRWIVIGGDFNASTQIDEVYGGRSHAIFFERLEDFGLESCTSPFYPGHEKTNLHPRQKVPYQNDYIYASKPLIPFLTNCIIGNEEEIKGLSDHLPVIVEFDL